jgi:succinate dehydrogenase/fumarate reductase flavoprotein subunit
MMDIQEYDVCVVGSGAAGLAAALGAQLAGKTVLVLEKTGLFGGTTAYSAGAMWIPNSDQAIARGIADSPEQALQYLCCHVGPHLDREKACRYLDAAPAMLRLFEKHGFLRMKLVSNWADYHCAEPGGASGGRSVVPRIFDGRELGKWFVKLRPPLRTMMGPGGFMLDIDDLPHLYRIKASRRSAARMGKLLLRCFTDRIRHARGTRLAGGNALIGRLAAHLFDRGISLWLDASAKELIVDAGRVTGIIVERDAERVAVRVRCGVILAAGGYSRDLERLQRTHKHIANGQTHVMIPPEGNTGDSIRMAEAKGARFSKVGHHPAAWTPVSLVPNKSGEAVAFPHFIDRGKPGYMSVDRRGNRFVSESKSYHVFGAAMIDACRGDETVEVWNICDHRSIRRFGLGALGPAPMPRGAFIRSGYIRRARTLDELAKACGIDAEGLKRTAARFNRFAETGVDLDFHRGDDAYQIFNGFRGHAPNPCLGAIEQPPFYAVKMQIGDLGTFSGLATNSDAQVLDNHHQPIPGLYAAGNDAASFMAGTYPGSGISIGSAMVFGYLAGQHASSHGLTPPMT